MTTLSRPAHRREGRLLELLARLRCSVATLISGSAGEQPSRVHR